MGEPRTIKKYPNRRLYDTVRSCYITLADLRDLIVERVDFVVIEKTTHLDITRFVLLQVIADQERGAGALLGSDFLIQVIRSYGSSMQTAIPSYLEQSMRQLLAPTVAGAAAR